MKKTLSLILAGLILCLSLSGCELKLPDGFTLPQFIPTSPTTEPTAQASNPTQSPTEQTVPPTTEPWVGQHYLDAIAKLKDAGAMEISVDRVMTVAGQSFRTESVQSIAYWNAGTDNFAATVCESTDLGEYAYSMDEIYADGAVYQTLNDCLFTSQMETEDFCARYPGLQLLNPDLYHVREENGGTVLYFENATALESWLADEDAELLSAEAQVLLSADGQIVECTYTVCYNYGPGHFETTYNAVYSVPKAAPSVPENAEDYLTVESIDGMWLLDIAYGYLKQARQYTTQSLSNIQSQAAGVILNRQYNLDSCSLDSSNPAYRLQTGVYVYQNGETYDSDMDEKFINGRYSISTDGGEESYDAGVTAQVMEEYTGEFIVENIFDTSGLINATITDIGSLILVEYACSEEQALRLCEYLNYELFDEADLLGRYASAYKTNKLDYYLSIDKYTMLPVAVGYLYEGCHTIEGMECLLTEQLDQSFDLASLTAYEEIFEETSPDAEPEVKPTPLFYRVTGDQGQEMWLFGTIHVGDDRTGFLPQEIFDALAQSHALAVECDTEGFSEALEDDEDLQSKVSSCYYYSNGQISDHLDTDDLYEDAVRVMKATGNYFYNSEYMKAALWSSDIDNYYLSQGHQLVSEKGIERRLEDFAEENGIPLVEVESSLFQIRMMTDYSDELQEFQLYNSVYSHGMANWEATMELYELWLSGDETALIEEMVRTPWSYEESDFENLDELDAEERARAEKILADLDNINARLAELHEEYVVAMEISRNAGMLETAKKYLESGDTVFMAVGLAHLLAEDGLVFTLRDAGYTVELITFD